MGCAYSSNRKIEPKNQTSSSIIKKIRSKSLSINLRNDSFLQFQREELKKIDSRYEGLSPERKEKVSLLVLNVNKGEFRKTSNLSDFSKSNTTPTNPLNNSNSKNQQNIPLKIETQLPALNVRRMPRSQSSKLKPYLIKLRQPKKTFNASTLRPTNEDSHRSDKSLYKQVFLKEKYAINSPSSKVSNFGDNFGYLSIFSQQSVANKTLDSSYKRIDLTLSKNSKDHNVLRSFENYDSKLADLSKRCNLSLYTAKKMAKGDNKDFSTFENYSSSKSKLSFPEKTKKLDFGVEELKSQKLSRKEPRALSGVFGSEILSKLKSRKKRFSTIKIPASRKGSQFKVMMGLDLLSSMKRKASKKKNSIKFNQAED